MFLSKTSKKQNSNYVDSLRPCGNLTLVSEVCEAVPRSLFCAPNGLNELPEGCFEFLFTLIGKSTMAFSFGAVLQTDITGVLFRLWHRLYVDYYCWQAATEQLCN